jgi:hypothetical protein
LSSLNGLLLKPRTYAIETRFGRIGSDMVVRASYRRLLEELKKYSKERYAQGLSEV